MPNGWAVQFLKRLRGMPQDPAFQGAPGQIPMGSASPMMMGQNRGDLQSRQMPPFAEAMPNPQMAQQRLALGSQGFAQPNQAPGLAQMYGQGGPALQARSMPPLAMMAPPPMIGQPGLQTAGGPQQIPIDLLRKLAMMRRF
jgi:hypothetical protein